MRQRKAKNMEERIQALSHYLIEEPSKCRGNWKQILGGPEDIYLELGCGKGQFLTKQALLREDAGFIGIEGQDSVLLRSLEKAGQAEIANIRFVHLFVHDIRQLFADSELAGIYLNFSDPWPKKRHMKRRLTYGEYLKQYRQVLRPDGFMAVKTDNDGLFDFTLEEIERVGLEIAEQSFNLHESSLSAKAVTTEYEDRFQAAGKPIHYVKIR